MEQITAKKARELLVENMSHFCGVIRKKHPQDYIALQIDNYEKNINLDILELRKVEKQQSNKIQFTGGSWLDFTKTNCHQFNNYIVVSKEDDYFNMVYRLEV